MKNIVFLRNYIKLHVLIKDLANPQKYNFFAVCDDVGYKSLKENDEIKYFRQVFILSDFNYTEIKKIINQITETFPADITIPISTRDKSICEVGQFLFENGREKTNLSQFVDKIKMKTLLADAEIRLPKYINLPSLKRQNITLEDIEKEIVSLDIRMPIFAKPINSAGSTNVRKINDKKSLIKWWNDIKQLPNIDFEIDEFIEGSLYHCDTFIKDYNYLYTQISKYSCPCADFLHAQPLGSIALDPSDENYKRLVDFTHKCLNKLTPPRNGITHLELFLTKDNEIVFLEVAARPPGAFAPDIYEKYLGVNIDKEHILLSIEDDHLPSIKKGQYSAGFIFPKSKGLVKKINQFEIVSNYNFKLFIKENDFYDWPGDISYMAGEINIWHEDYNVVLEDFNKLSKFSICEVETKNSGNV